MNIKVKKMNPKAILPEYQTIGSAGADFHACIDDSLIIKPGQVKRIPTGIAVEIPKGYELQIRSRSSLGYKYSIAMINGVGTIDSDYRGEMSVTLINLGDDDFIVEPNMRIAQMVVSSCEQVVWEEVDRLSETERGEGGFGSTGIGEK